MNHSLEKLELLISEIEKRVCHETKTLNDSPDALRLVAFAKRVMKVGRGQFVNFWAEELLECMEVT